MLCLRDSIRIEAPVERCFRLSLSLAIVERELGMHPVAHPEATRTAGLAAAGDRIRWEGWQLGLPQYHVSLISVFERDRFFQDTMIAGRFRSFQHDHGFVAEGGGTVLEDAIRFAMPWGVAGWLVGRWVMVPHIRGLMRRRFRLLKRIAESEEWRRYVAE